MMRMCSISVHDKHPPTTSSSSFIYNHDKGKRTISFEMRCSEAAQKIAYMKRLSVFRKNLNQLRVQIRFYEQKVEVIRKLERMNFW